MIKRLIPSTILLITALFLIPSLAQTQTESSRNEQRNKSVTDTSGSRFFNLLAQSRHSRRLAFILMSSGRSTNTTAPRFTFTPMAAGANQPVFGIGDVGRLTKWTAFTNGRSLIGNSTIFENSNGMVGIGTDSPTSRLTVVGLIETINPGGGIKFPDGTIQTTAGLGSIFHDASLTGNGTQSMPLAIAPLGVQTNHLANLAVTGAKIANGSVVRSLNGLFDNVSLAAGSNITITPGANTLTIAATGLLGSVNRDSTLTGNGTSGSPLGVTVPLRLTGSRIGPILSVENDQSTGILGQGTGIASGVVGLTGPGPWPACGESGVCGSSFSKKGVLGVSTDSFGVAGFSSNSVGVFGYDNGIQSLPCPSSAICGTAFNKPGTVGLSVNGSGVFGQSGFGLAGQFDGDVDISGTLSAAAKNFKIDHPLDPENKYLNHVSVESPDMKNIYDGNVTTNENGEAMVELPDYFEALNRDFRYQLTVIGTFAQAIVADEIKDNRFTIRTNAPGVKVSWQVTGIRQDGWAKKNRIQVEVEKSERERGYYLHPEAYDQPEERSIQHLKHPELVKQTKEVRQQR
jgi:hypothetical protein